MRAFPLKPLWVNVVDCLMKTHGGLASYIFKWSIWLHPLPGQNNWTNSQQHMKQHSRSRKPQICQSRFMRNFPSLSSEDGSNLYWKALITVCPETNNENKPGIKTLMAQRHYHKKDYSHSLPSSIQKWSHKEESNHPKSSKTVSACKLSKVWGSGEGEAPQALATANQTHRHVSCCISLLSEATPLRNC